VCMCVCACSAHHVIVQYLYNSNYTVAVHLFSSHVGASSDVEAASRLARAMITKYAMSDVVSTFTTLCNLCHPGPP